MKPPPANVFADALIRLIVPVPVIVRLDPPTSHAVVVPDEPVIDHVLVPIARVFESVVIDQNEFAVDEFVSVTL